MHQYCAKFLSIHFLRGNTNFFVRATHYCNAMDVRVLLIVYKPFSVLLVFHIETTTHFLNH